MCIRDRDYLIGTGIDLRIGSGTDGLELVRRFRAGHVSIQQDDALAVHYLQPAYLLLTGGVLIAETQHVFACLLYTSQDLTNIWISLKMQLKIRLQS